MASKASKKNGAKKNEISMKYDVFDFDLLINDRPASSFMIALGRICAKSFRVPTTIKLDSMVESIEKKGEAFDRLKEKICEEHGKKNDKGGYKIDDDKKKDFEEKYKELLEQTFKITLDKVKLPNDIEISQSEFRLTKDIFEFVEPKRG